ncbi:lactase/phlorizin hydrolase-like [Cydia splendana]|uniref:lactase/phlorizin hydrolase-like n=1 Tax=Cydia splendana TaxID=1100963 RepID=UPI00300D57C0
MGCMKAVIIGLVLCVAAAERRFPDGFKFGTATSSYQIEGAWNASDKGESIWDRFVHTKPEAVSDRSNGDVACDSYNQWREDIQLLEDLNVDYYRFSISWPRVLPTGFANRVSEDGARYYGALIDALLEKGIEPVVTLYHWDLPQTLQDLGGWANPLISGWFADYARVIFDLYGDRVKTWLTINEPVVVCDVGYVWFDSISRLERPAGSRTTPVWSTTCTETASRPGSPSTNLSSSAMLGMSGLTVYPGWSDPLAGATRWFADYAREVYDLYGDRVKTWLTINEPVVVCDVGYTVYIAPGLESEGRGSYMCTKNILLAHAKVYRLYEAEYKPQYQGQVSLTNQMMWFVPETEEDAELTELVKVYTIDRYCHPIFSAAGGWPPELERHIAQQSAEEGEPRSRLPPFTQEEIELVRGSYDYLALNHYTTRTVRRAGEGEVGTFLVDGFRELGVMLGNIPEWLTTTPHQPEDGTFLVDGFRELGVMLGNIPEWLTTTPHQPEDGTFLVDGFRELGVMLGNIPEWLTTTPHQPEDGTFLVDGFRELGVMLGNIPEWLTTTPHQPEDGTFLVDGFRELGVMLGNIPEWLTTTPHQPEDGTFLVDGFRELGVMLGNIPEWLTTTPHQPEDGTFLVDGFRELGVMLGNIPEWLTTTPHQPEDGTFLVDGFRELGVMLGNIPEWLTTTPHQPEDGTFLVDGFRELGVMLGNIPEWLTTTPHQPEDGTFLVDGFRELGVMLGNIPEWLTTTPHQPEDGTFLVDGFRELGVMLGNIPEWLTTTPHQPEDGTFLVDGFRELGVMLGNIPEWLTTTPHQPEVRTARSWWTASASSASCWGTSPSGFTTTPHQPEVHPGGIRALLGYVKQQYGDVPVYIMENGLTDLGTALDDQPRATYFRNYLEQVLLAMEEDGVNVMRYTVWSLLDNFEWVHGYQLHFGLHHVDFSSPQRTRTARRSARYYAAVARTKDLDAEYQFDNMADEL